MRLTVQVSTLHIINGPGTTALLDAWIEKEDQGYKEPTGPRLEFTVEHYQSGNPQKVTVDLIGRIYKLPIGSYTFRAYWGQNPVKITYSLKPDSSGRRGRIEDI